MGKTLRPLLLVLVVVAAATGAWWWLKRGATPDDLKLLGNVDFRQASVSFNGAEPIAQILVEEGDGVKRGQVLARLDTSRLEPQVAQASANAESQRAALRQLQNGSRPEEIAQARANLESAKADAANAAAQFERKRTLAATSIASQQDLDSARAAADVAKARVAQAQSALDLVVAGPRVEQIDQARALLQAGEAQLALARRQLADAELRAPFDAVVRARLMEPGEMASPQRPVLSLAETGTKWVRAYVSEPRLGLVRPGMRARVTTDAFPTDALDGWIGYISPVAEFTPKTVQSEDLRTSLVYELRVMVDDPRNVLRLGMPATVVLLPDAPPHDDAPATAAR